MTFTLVTTRHFERRARKFLHKHPNLKPVLADTLERLRLDPFQPRLRLHGLGGNLSGIQGVSLTHSYLVNPVTGGPWLGGQQVRKQWEQLSLLFVL